MRYKNPLSELTHTETVAKYKADIRKNPLICASAEDDSEKPLKSLNPNQVEFIGGMWRIQRDFNLYVEKIYDKYFVMGKRIEREKLPKEEIPIFNYYNALLVESNCYGFYTYDFGYIVANCENIWRYGKDISEARSKLSGNIIDNLTKNKCFCTEIVKMISLQNVK